MACSSPEDCAEIERRLSSGHGLLADDGASRGNLFSGDAEAMILTVSRMSAEKRANPGYRAFLANGFNVTRLLVLFFWEVVLEKVAATQQRRRRRTSARPPGRHVSAAARVDVRRRARPDRVRRPDRHDAGRPAVYATFSSYDEVAHHSGLERADTLEALRKLDEQFGRIDRARRFAPRPYKLVVLSDHGQTQGATFKQRNGYDLHDAGRAVDRAAPASRTCPTGDENDVGGRPRGGGGDRTAERRPEVQVRHRRRERRDRARVGQSRAHLPDGRAAPAVPGGDRGAPPEAARDAAPASAHRLPARSLAGAGSGRARPPRGAVPDRRLASRARTRSRRSRPAQPTTCDAPTASSTSPTSWSTASTTLSSSRAARSRS